MRTDDLVITIAYFSIPFQILASLYQYPRLAAMPLKVQILVVLFAFFIFLCGAGHALRCMEMTHKPVFQVINFCTALISMTTCLYLIPLVPSLMSSLDSSLQSLIDLNEELDLSKRKLMTFMAFLCHEIRNPLFVITSNLSFMEEDSPNQATEEQEQALQAISQSVDLMVRLVNDVLDISKLESGKLELHEHDFDLHDTLDAVIRSTKRVVLQLHKGAVNFTASIADDVPHGVRGDSVRLLQILFNLLSNANKFTEKGFIDLSVSVVDATEAMNKGLLTRMERAKSASAVSSNHADSSDERASDDEEGDFALNLLDTVEQGRAATETDDRIVLRIRVQDTGPGIPAEHTARIFQPYSQSKLSDYRKHGGTGLGLAIVAKLAQAMGGKVTVDSHMGKGSVFEAILVVHTVPSEGLPPAVRQPDPYLDDHGSTQQEGLELPPKVPSYESSIAVDAFSTLVPPPPTSQSPTPPPKRQKNKLQMFPDGLDHVLVVDDNDMNRKLLKRMLAQMNLSHLEASNGQEAVDVMLQTRDRTHLPDSPRVGMILMDISMPVMDGLEATEAIRQHPEFKDLPIVALTAAAVVDSRENCESVGMTEYQTKPIRRDHLREVCQRYLVDVSNSSQNTDTDSDDRQSHIADLLV